MPHLLSLSDYEQAFFLPQGAALFYLLLLARQSHSQPPVLVRPVATPEYLAGGGPALRAASEAAAPLCYYPTARPAGYRWPACCPPRPRSRPTCWAPTPTRWPVTLGGAGRVRLALTLRNVPAGAYRLRLSQNGQQWQLPIAVK